LELLQREEILIESYDRPGKLKDKLKRELLRLPQARYSSHNAVSEDRNIIIIVLTAAYHPAYHCLLASEAKQGWSWSVPG
jgi:hypothetical protein